MNEVDLYVASAIGFCMRCIINFSNNSTKNVIYIYIYNKKKKVNLYIDIK